MTDVSLTALHGILFEQIDRLNDPDLGNDELEREIARAEAMEGIAGKIISNAGTMVKVASSMTGNSEMRELKQTLVNTRSLPQGGGAYETL